MEILKENEELEFKEYSPHYVQETYKIPQFNMGKLMEKVDKLNSKAGKMGLPPIIVDIINQYDIEVKTNQYGHECRPYKMRMVEVKVEGNSPKFEGWTFIATIEHEKAAKNLVKAIPNVELDYKYRDASPNCDHCHTNRWRKKTYVCRHDDGREVQVGSTCIKDFLGHATPEFIAWQCEMWGQIQEMFGEDPDEIGYRCPRSEMRIDTTEFLEITAKVIRKSGWISKSKVFENPYEYPISTSEMVLDLWSEAFNDRKRIPIKPQDEELAELALEWAKNLIPDKDGKFSDYEYNINVLANEPSIAISDAGLAASIVGVFKMKRDREAQQKEVKVSEHFGEVKKRYELELKVVSISGFENDWGYTTIYKMTDMDGRAFCWFSTSKIVSLELDETYKVKATVKGHQDWNNRKETMLARLNVMEEVEK